MSRFGRYYWIWLQVLKDRAIFSFNDDILSRNLVVTIYFTQKRVFIYIRDKIFALLSWSKNNKQVQRTFKCVWHKLSYTFGWGYRVWYILFYLKNKRTSSFSYNLSTWLKRLERPIGKHRFLQLILKNHLTAGTVIQTISFCFKTLNNSIWDKNSTERTRILIYIDAIKRRIDLLPKQHDTKLKWMASLNFCSCSATSACNWIVSAMPNGFSHLLKTVLICNALLM